MNLLEILSGCVRRAIPMLAAIWLICAAQSARGQAVTPLQAEHDVTVGSMVSDRFTWKDSANQPRVAVLAHNDAGAGPGGAQGGALREFRYQLPGAITRIATVTTYPNAGYAGFGYVVAHSAAGSCIGDDSPLGGFVAGHWQRIFEGRHHAIFRFTQNYPRNCPDIARTIPVTIDWIFSTGHDNPVYAINYDVDLVVPSTPVNTLFDDSRAPYGELNIDGDGSTDIDGVAWGDRRKFTSTSAPVTLSSSWTYDTPNTVPYVKEWIAGPLSGGNNIKDATMGLVQTQAMDQQDGGGARQEFYHDITVLWDTTSATGNVYPECAAYTMPCQDEWAYQANADSIGIGVANNNARMTWRTNFGFLGQATYPARDGTGANPPGYPKKSYSVYIVLGTHSSGAVETQLTQVETAKTLTLTTANGSVVTSGPAGITRVDNVTYVPAGYNHIYGALAFSANSNQLDANIAVGSGTLKKPLVIVSGYTVGDPQVKLGSVVLTADVDYFASVRPAANEIWITLNRDLTGATNHLEVLGPAGGAPAAPTGVTAGAVTSTRVDMTWTAPIGAVSYQVDRETTLGGGFVQIGTPGVNSFSDTTASASTAYLYRVRAVNGSGTSPNSASDLATTVIFTDALAAGVVVKAVHLSELRTAVNAVRALAGVGAAGFTDAATAGTTIKAVHVTELRSALDGARGALSLSTGGYTDGAPAGLAVKAVHFQELRNGVQ